MFCCIIGVLAYEKHYCHFPSMLICHRKVFNTISKSRPSLLSRLVNSDEAAPGDTFEFPNTSVPPRKTPQQHVPRTGFLLVRRATAFFCFKIICQQCIATIIYLKINRLWPHSALNTFAAQSRCWALI